MSVLGNAYKIHLDHLVKLTQHEGWRGYALAQAAKLSKHPSGLYAGIDKDLTEKIKEMQDDQEKTDRQNPR